MDTLAAAAPLPLLAASISRVVGERSDRRSGLPVPGHSAPTMLRPPRVVEAVGAPIAVQLRSGQAPHRPLAWVGGDGAEFGHQPARGIQRQGVLVDPPPP